MAKCKKQKRFEAEFRAARGNLWYSLRLQSLAKNSDSFNFSGNPQNDTYAYGVSESLYSNLKDFYNTYPNHMTVDAFENISWVYYIFGIGDKTVFDYIADTSGVLLRYEDVLVK